jgi:hypothetical protein
MKQQPGGRRLGGPIRQQIDRAARVEIDEYGAIGAAFAHGIKLSHFVTEATRLQNRA